VSAGRRFFGAVVVALCVDQFGAAMSVPVLDDSFAADRAGLTILAFMAVMVLSGPRNT
jgi:hypothetical protein